MDGVDEYGLVQEWWLGRVKFHFVWSDPQNFAGDDFKSPLIYVCPRSFYKMRAALRTALTYTLWDKNAICRRRLIIATHDRTTTYHQYTAARAIGTAKVSCSHLQSRMKYAAISRRNSPAQYANNISVPVSWRCDGPTISIPWKKRDTWLRLVTIATIKKANRQHKNRIKRLQTGFGRSVEVTAIIKQMLLTGLPGWTFKIPRERKISKLIIVLECACSISTPVSLRCVGPTNFIPDYHSECYKRRA